MRASPTARELTPPAEPALPSGSPRPSSRLDLLRPADAGAQAAADALGLAMPTGIADLIKADASANAIAIAAVPQLEPTKTGLAMPATGETGSDLSAPARPAAVTPTDGALASAGGDAAEEPAASGAPIPHADPPRPDMAAAPEAPARSHQSRLIGAADHDFGPAERRADAARGTDDFARSDTAEPLRFGFGHHGHTRAASLDSSSLISANLAGVSDELTDLSTRLHDQATRFAERVHEITLNPLAGPGDANDWGNDHTAPAHAFDDPPSNDHASSASDDHASAPSQAHASMHDGPTASAQAHDPHSDVDPAHGAPPAPPIASGDSIAAATHPAPIAADDDSATAIAAPAAAPSLGPLIESGARAILLQSDAAPSAASPPPDARSRHGVPGDGAPAFTPAFAPDILSARDQLASAIATASPETAAITTLTPTHATGLQVATLGADLHALKPLQAHGG
jgi:hypothetical protein